MRTIISLKEAQTAINKLWVLQRCEEVKIRFRMIGARPLHSLLLARSLRFAGTRRILMSVPNRKNVGAGYDAP
jgi:hypothetical protein